jgi:hypothetical protein
MKQKPPARADARSAATDLLVEALNDLVIEMVEAKCSTLNERDQNTLKRRIRKAVESFVKDREK